MKKHHSSLLNLRTTWLESCVGVVCTCPPNAHAKHYRWLSRHWESCLLVESSMRRLDLISLENSPYIDYAFFFSKVLLMLLASLTVFPLLLFFLFFSILARTYMITCRRCFMIRCTRTAGIGRAMLRKLVTTLHRNAPKAANRRHRRPHQGHRPGCIAASTTAASRSVPTSRAYTWRPAPLFVAHLQTATSAQRESARQRQTLGV